MGEKRDYGAVKDQVDRAAGLLHGTVKTLATIDGYPLLQLTFGAQGGPRVWVNAGIHGEEPGSVEGLLLWLETSASRWADTFSFKVLPCLNPYGYERGERCDQSGLDPNRRFRQTDYPLVKAVLSALGEERYVFAVDMHEDCDFEGFYMYEVNRRPPSVHELVIPAVAEVGPICEEAEDPEVKGGLVSRAAEDGESMEAFFEGRDLWPIAYPLHRQSERSVTLETPGLRPLGQRARMQRAGVDACLRFAARSVAG